MAHGFLNGAKYDEKTSDVALLIERTITKYKIPEGTKTVGAAAFMYCYSLESVTIPESVEIIRSNAFSSTSALKELIFPLGCHTFDSWAINGSGVKKIVFGDTRVISANSLICSKCTVYDFSRNTSVPQLLNINAFGTDINANAKILVPAHLYEEWIVATNWSNFAQYTVPVYDAPEMSVPNRISEGLDYVLSYDGSYYDLLGLGSCTDTVLVIPSEYNGLPVMGIAINNSLGGNLNLVEVHIPESVRYYSYAFNDCANIERLYIGSSGISSFEFCGLTSLKYVKFTKLTNLEGGTFTGCTDAVFDFSECTTIPELNSYGYGQEFGTNPTIAVPATLYNEWVADTNWAIYADHIVVAA